MLASKHPKHDHWSIAEARLNLSEVIQLAKKHPQFLEKRGHPVAAVVDVDWLKEQETQKTSLGQRLLEEWAAIKAATTNEEVDWGDEITPRKDMIRDPFQGEDDVCF